MSNLKEAGTCCPVKVVRMPANFYAPSTGHSLTLDQKRCKWREEIKKHEEYLSWFYGIGAHDGAQWYLGSLEYGTYKDMADNAEEQIKKLKNKIRYARR